MRLTEALFYKRKDANDMYMFLPIKFLFFSITFVLASHSNDESIKFVIKVYVEYRRECCNSPVLLNIYMLV